MRKICKTGEINTTGEVNSKSTQRNTGCANNESAKRNKGCVNSKSQKGKTSNLRLFLLIITIIFLTNNIVFVHAANPASINDYIWDFQKETKCECVSAVTVTGKGIEYYGDENALYQIGSMTKAFTGLAVLKIINEGFIDEDDSVSELLPGFSAFYDSKPVEITVGQLLSQTSGYTNKEKDYPAASEDMSLAEWVGSITGKELSSKPGEKYAYSNVNYNLLGAIIERVSGKSYEEYMYEEILIPLGLNDTYVGKPDDEGRIVSGKRAGYRRAFKYDIQVFEGRIPAGYFYSNTSDMARWMLIWLGEADIPEEYTILINTVKKRLKGTGDYYSGWELFEGGVIGHSGGTSNYSSRMVFSDDGKTGVCVLTDMNVAASTDGLCNGIFRLITEGNADRIPTDVWTVFDIVFSILSLIGIIMIVVEINLKKRSIILVLGAAALILLLTVCIVMPAVFGAGLGEIMFIWAPYSFSGGIIILAFVVIAAVISIFIKRKNENRKKTG
ncbi:MAG: beta-lactamase family protein [Lachnospiraceae bacterium]|nr:beta-lactamase family protein [Lachnospiraceae bacterium]